MRAIEAGSERVGGKTTAGDEEGGMEGEDGVGGRGRDGGCRLGLEEATSGRGPPGGNGGEATVIMTTLVVFMKTMGRLATRAGGSWWPWMTGMEA